MPRLLTASERASFVLRHPWVALTVPFIPPEGKLVPDTELNCVLVFQKIDKTILTIKADDIYEDCVWNEGPSRSGAFISEFINQLQDRSKDIFDYIMRFMIYAIILLCVYFVASGKLQKLINDFK